MDESERGKWKALLKKNEFFSVFTSGELDEFLKSGQASKFRMHEYLVKENTDAKKFYVILKGKVDIVKEIAIKGKTQISSLEAGYVVGEIAMLLNEKRTATVITGEETFVFSIEADKIDNLPIETQAKLYKQLAIFLSKKLKSLSKASAEQLIGMSEWYQGPGKYGT
jgi:CRP-like cAMP-binding protein